MAEYLPPVVARLSFEYGDFLSGIAKCKTAMKSLEGTMKIDTSGLTAAAAKVDALKTSLNGLNGTVKVNADGLNTMAGKTAAAASASSSAAAIMTNGWIRTGTALHWVISGAAELAAVVIPAAIALGAGFAVMSQGAQMVQQHMSALSTATSADGQMFGKTAGDVLGLGHALQTAQDAANPSVYGILGSALITVKERMGSLTSTGLQVTRMFQTFAAKVAVDFGPGGSLGGVTSGLLSHMTSDLQGLGAVLGNVLHTVANVASSMPGVAEILLKTLSGITGFASHLSGIAGPLLTAGFAFEAFNRWGGLAAQAMTKVGMASASLSGGMFTMTRFASVVRGLASIAPQGLMQIGLLFEKLGAKGAANGLADAAAGLEGVISKIGPMQAALGVAGAVGLGIFIDKVVTAKSAIQQMTSSMQQAVLSISNVGAGGQALTNMGQLTQAINQAKTAASQVTPAEAKAGESFRAIGIDAGNAAVAVRQLSDGSKQQQQDLTNIAQGAAYLAKTYGTTYVGALALADQANATLASGITGTSQAAQIARMQIASLVQGYQAMGQGAGQVGNDMTMLAIQSGLAASNVGKLNSAAQEFMSNLTGGMSGLAGFATSLQNVGSVVASFHNNLGKALSIKDTVSQFAQSLASGAVKGAAAWQNFSQIVGQTGPQLISWMRTAGAEGALGAKGFTQAALDMASALMPLGAASKTAQSEILGLVATAVPGISTWKQLGEAVKTSGASLGGLNGIISGATAKMADMNSVAQTLGNVLSSALVSALQAAQVQASGAGQGWGQSRRAGFLLYVTV